MSFYVELRKIRTDFFFLLLAFFKYNYSSIINYWTDYIERLLFYHRRSIIKIRMSHVNNS